MTALFWRGVILAQLVLAMVAAWYAAPILSRAWQLEQWLVAAISAVVFIAVIQLTFAVGTLLVAAAYEARSTLVSGSVLSGSARRLRVACSEAAVFAVCQCLMAIEPWLSMTHSAGPRGNLRPVLLLHGVLCNRAVWWLLRRRLVAAGFGPVRAVNLEPAHASIDLLAIQARQAIVALSAEVSAVPVVVVAHSMGGLVARAALSAMDQEIDTPPVAQVITLGTPHRGSETARLCRGAACRQMRIGSSWLAALNLERPHRRVTAMTSIYSIDDNLVVPRASARLPGSQALAVTGIGHFGLLWSRQVAKLVIQQLESTAPSVARVSQ